jgi:hypothetical protein
MKNEPTVAALPLFHLHMICTREAGLVAAMIPDRLCCPR